MSYAEDIRTINELLTRAEQQAHSLGDSQPGAEHLVLAALMLEEDSARQLLGVGAMEFREALIRTHAAAVEATGIVPPEDGLPVVTRRPRLYQSETSAQDVFQRARQLAKRARPKQRLQGSHIVRAAAERQYGTVAQVLITLGIDREKLL
jgi:ATP-dependent Clp protease ATP-binding subunit ClpA